MITLRRARVAVLAVPVLLAGCGSGEVLTGSGTVSGAAGTSAGAPSPAVSSSAGFPSPSPSGSSTASTGTGPAAPIARFSRLTGSGTGVILDPAFVRALTTLTVTPGVVGTTRLSGRILAFPITGGTASVFATGSRVPAVASVQHVGSGISLSAGGVKIELTNFTFVLGPESYASGTVLVNGRTAAEGARLFDLDTASVRTGASGSTASLLGLGVRFSADLVKVLNAAFATSAFTASLDVGDATMSLTGS